MLVSQKRFYENIQDFRKRWFKAAMPTAQQPSWIRRNATNKTIQLKLIGSQKLRLFKRVHAVLSIQILILPRAGHSSLLN